MRLEPFTAEHLLCVRDLLTAPTATRHGRVPEPVPFDFEQTWAALYAQGRADGTRMDFAITLDEGELAGLALAPHLDTATATAELGYLVAPWARGRGVAGEALRLLTAWAFEHGMQRLELYIGAGNEASRRVARRCGYSREGVLRSRHEQDTGEQDIELWSRLVTDPERPPGATSPEISP